MVVAVREVIRFARSGGVKGPLYVYRRASWRFLLWMTQPPHNRCHSGDVIISSIVGPSPRLLLPGRLCPRTPAIRFMIMPILRVTAMQIQTIMAWPTRLLTSVPAAPAPRDLDIGHSQIRLQIVCLHLCIPLSCYSQSVSQTHFASLRYSLQIAHIWILGLQIQHKGAIQLAKAVHDTIQQTSQPVRVS